MHPQGRVRQGNTRKAKTKSCKLEVDKRLKRFYLPLENHSSSSASPRWKADNRNEGRKTQKMSTGSWSSKQESPEKKTKNTGNTGRNGEEGPGLVVFLSFNAPITDTDTPPPPPPPPPF
jgi:hypothetical protein